MKQEAGGIEPRLGHSSPQRGKFPVALLAMPTEGRVVHT
jgi:hypothetical protein